VCSQSLRHIAHPSARLRQIAHYDEIGVNFRGELRANKLREEPPVTHEQISALVVGDRYMYTGEIETMLRHTRWNIAKASSVVEAIAILALRQFHVVLCQRRLENGTWLDVLQAIEQYQPHAAVVVLCKGDGTAAMTDLCLGAYDVLPVPCNALELYTTVTSAWRHYRQKEQAAMVASKTA
jgi:DNA-binding NtrC family response regulator